MAVLTASLMEAEFHVAGPQVRVVGLLGALHRQGDSVWQCLRERVELIRPHSWLVRHVDDGHDDTVAGMRGEPGAADQCTQRRRSHAICGMSGRYARALRRMSSAGSSGRNSAPQST